jgi:hypothetical protein
MHPTRSRRALRAVGASWVATFVALFSHVAGGGAVPGFAGIAVPLALSTLVCLALSGRRTSLVRLSLGVVLSQGAFHALFVLGAGGAASPGAVADGHAAHAGHAGDHLISLPVADSAAVASGPAMWVGHAVAAVLTVLAIRHADVILARLASLRDRVWVTVLPVLALLPVDEPLRRAARVVIRTRPFVVLHRLDGDLLALRGPPARLAS